MTGVWVDGLNALPNVPPPSLHSQTLKGVGGDVIILEEAAACAPKMVKEVVVPLLVVDTSVLICISTLKDSDNSYSKMFNCKNPDGTTMFEQRQIDLVCADCRKSDNPQDCTHKFALMPRWLSSAKLEKVKALLDDDPVRAISDIDLVDDTTT